MSDLIKELEKLSDPVYQKFNQNVVKGDSPIIGVRIPTLRKIAKRIKKENKVDLFFQEYEGKYFEEKLIKGLLLASDKELFLERIDEYLEEIDSWCLCDTFCISCKFIKSELNEYFPLILKMLESDKEFIIRTGYVLILNYYINDEYIERVFELIKKDYSYYYVNMAIAWLISEIYLSYPVKVKELLASEINEFVKNKAIDKINDSFRVSELEKMRLRKLK